MGMEINHFFSMIGYNMESTEKILINYNININYSLN